MRVGTREALITAATDLLDSGGPERVTLREVGRRAGVSHNAPYKHFAAKETLLAAVAARELDALSGQIAASRERHSAIDALEQVMRGYVAWALAHPPRFALVFGSWPTGHPELAEAADRTWTMIVDTVAAAQLAGGLPVGEPERLAALLRSVAHGAIDLAIAGHLAGDGKGRATPDDLVADLFHVLRRT